MRIGHQDRFYVVVDPTPECELADIFFACDFHDLELQIKGGLSHERRPAIFTERADGEREAERRLAAMKAVQVMLETSETKIATKLQLLGPGGEVILDVDLPGASEACRD